MGKLLCPALLGLFLLSALGFPAGMQAWAGSDMLRVQVEMDISQADSQQERDLYPELRDLGFAQALLRKTAEFLPGSLAEDRRKALVDFFLPRADAFVLSYSEQGTQVNGDTLHMGLAVKINNWALKEFLQTWGIYYTANATWEYSLQSEVGLQEQDLMRLQELQQVSGLQRKNAGLPRLELNKSGDGQPWWQGRLQTQEQEWTRTADNLPEVWSGLWQEYFAQEKVRSRVVQELVLQAWGWSGVTGIWEFDRSLSSWDLIAKRPRIIQLELRRGQLQSSWKLQTRQQEKLQRMLRQEMEPKGLGFSLKQAEEYHAELVPAAAE